MIINTDRQTSEDRLLPKSVIITEVTEKLSSTKMTPNRQTNKWRYSISIRNKYAGYCDTFGNTLEPFSAILDGCLGCIFAVSHRGDLESSNISPIKSRPYRVGPKDDDFEKSELDNMLAMNVFEPAQTEWASPVVFGPEIDGTLRFCVNYKTLNAAATQDSYLLPRTDESIHPLESVWVFSAMDVNRGYWQMEANVSDEENTSLTPHHGLFQFTRSRLGLKNAFTTFQPVMDTIPLSVRWLYELF